MKVSDARGKTTRSILNTQEVDEPPVNGSEVVDAEFL